MAEDPPNPPKEPASIQGRSSLGGRIDFQAELDEQGRQRERAAKWASERWKRPADCIVCGSNNWTIGDVLELRPFRGGNFVIGRGPIFPVFPVTCNVCGNTVFINAVAAGVVLPPSAETFEDPDV